MTIGPKTIDELISNCLDSNPLPSKNYIDSGSLVLDCGCYGWRLADTCLEKGAQLIGVDRSLPPGKPAGVNFATMTGAYIDIPDDSADLVVASHILEHIHESVQFMTELVRITRPGGTIWIESPSELSATFAGTDACTDHSFSSFWDDPTHVRPWSPGAMYRLALSCHCIPIAIGRVNADGIPSTRFVGRKPISDTGTTESRYVTLRGVAPGLRNAWDHVWGEIHS